MIPNKGKEGWHYLAVKILSTLLRKITLKHHGDFYCLNSLHSFRTENKLRFDHIEDKHTLHHERDCMKKLCTSLKEHAKI